METPNYSNISEEFQVSTTSQTSRPTLPCFSARIAAFSGKENRFQPGGRAPLGTETST
jgi:hypothetical protein